MCLAGAVVPPAWNVGQVLGCHDVGCVLTSVLLTLLQPWDRPWLQPMLRSGAEGSGEPVGLLHLAGQAANGQVVHATALHTT